MERNKTSLRIIRGGKMINEAKQVVVVDQQQRVPGLDGPNLKAIESVLMKGDLIELSIERRILFYRTLCESLQLNWMTRPFGYIVIDGKLTLYALKDCTEQLRRTFNVSIVDMDEKMLGDSYVVKVTASMPSGRTDKGTGAVWMKGLAGKEHANALMKAETKAKRRVTLSICGLGFVVDETEASSIKGAQIVDENYQPEWVMSSEQRKELNETKNRNGWTGRDLGAFLKEKFQKDRLTSLAEYDEVLKHVSQPKPWEPSAEQWELLYGAMGTNGYSQSDLDYVIQNRTVGRISSLAEYQDVLHALSQSPDCDHTPISMAEMMNDAKRKGEYQAHGLGT